MPGEIDMLWEVSLEITITEPPYQIDTIGPSVLILFLQAVDVGIALGFKAKDGILEDIPGQRVRPTYDNSMSCQPNLLANPESLEPGSLEQGQNLNELYL